MAIASGIAIYFIIWWIVFFLALTTGNRAPESEAAQVAGAERGAPARPHIWRKVGLTTVIAAVAFVALLGLLNSGLTLKDIPLPAAPGT
ncbi:MAG: hypothetical protein AcusKO_33360 [Acuticoccus sp.]